MPAPGSISWRCRRVFRRCPATSGSFPTDAPALGAVGSILGYPVILTHAAPATNTVNNKVAVFGDPMGLGVGLRSDFQFASSDQILFKEDCTVFRARARAAIKVKQATAFGVLTLAAS